MRAAVISIGSELLRGDIVDTNAAYLNGRLTHLGFLPQRVWQVRDDLADLTGVVREALRIADVVLCTGGLGPTQDDLTREAIAAVLGEEQSVDPELQRTLVSRFESMGRRMPATNIQQARLIPSAVTVPNPNGSAPGWFVQRDGKTIVTMPGPPNEMQPMWRDWVETRLAGLLAKRTASRALMTFGVGESHVEERIADIISWRPEVTVATYAKAAGVQVHITAHADTGPDAERLAQEAQGMVESRLGIAVFGVGTDTLPEVLARMLAEKNLTLAVMESATGGALCDMVTSVSGASAHFLGGIVSYSPDVKELHGVPRETLQTNGVISAETARAMAVAVREHLHADIGLSVTGIAGAEPVEDKPAGTCFLGLAMEHGVTHQEIRRPGRRDVAKRYFASCALDLVRRELSGNSGSGE